MSRKFFALFGLIAALSFLAGPGWADKPFDAKAAFKGFPEFMTKALADWKVPGVAVAVKGRRYDPKLYSLDVGSLAATRTANAGGNSAYSNSISATTLPAAPAPITI